MLRTGSSLSLNRPPMALWTVLGAVSLTVSACMSTVAVCDPQRVAPPRSLEDGGTSAPVVTEGCFLPVSCGPLMGPGLGWATARWSDPSVVRDGDRLVMYAASDRDGDLALAIYRLVSTDGRAWTLDPQTPVLAPSPSGMDWDHGGVFAPSVVRFQGRWHLFYEGFPTIYERRSAHSIGHAASEDGVTWQRDHSPVVMPSAPGSAPNFAFDQSRVGDPGAVVRGDTLLLYFAAQGVDRALGSVWQTLGRVESTDAERWSPPAQVLTANLSSLPREQFLGLAAPSPLVLGDTVHLFFTALNEGVGLQTQLLHAASPDGRGNFTWDTQPVFTAGAFGFTTQSLSGPAVVQDGATVRLFFGGDDGASLYIGAAACGP